MGLFEHNVCIILFGVFVHVEFICCEQMHSGLGDQIGRLIHLLAVCGRWSLQICACLYVFVCAISIGI